MVVLEGPLQEGPFLGEHEWWGVAWALFWENRALRRALGRDLLSANHPLGDPACSAPTAAGG